MNLKKHFSGQGGINQLLAIALPMVVSQACETVMMFTDRLFLSRISHLSMSAAMSGGLTAFVLMTFFIGLISYSSAIVAQYLGSNQIHKCCVTVTQSVIIAIICYPLLIYLIPLGIKLFKFTGQSENQLPLSSVYFKIIIYGGIFALLRNCFVSFFSGIGKTRIVMFSALFTMSVNIIANYILIFGKAGFPQLGIKGAAIGTIIGSFCGFLFVLIGYIHHTIKNQNFKLTESFRFDVEVIKKLFRFGYPNGLELFLNLLAFDLMVLLFQSYGPDVAAAVTIAFNWDMVSFVPLIGMNIGVTSLVARFSGAKKPSLVSRATFSGLKVVVFYGIIMIILYVIFPKFFVQIFLAQSQSGQIAILAEFMVRMVAFYILFDGFNLVFSGALRGSGDTFWTMIISVACHWLFTVEAIVLVKILKVDPRISWTAFVFTIPVIAGAFIIRYRSGKWKKIKVID